MEREPWEMVKRLYGENRDAWLYEQAYRRGIGCFFCATEVDVWNYDVHHLDKAYVPLNARENTAPSHHTCNSATEREAAAHRILRVRESEGRFWSEIESDPAIALMRKAGYETGSAEMRAKGVGYALFVRWFYPAVFNAPHGTMLKSHAINSGAWVTGLSTATTRKYLDALASPEGPFMEEGEGYDKVVHLKPAVRDRLRRLAGEGQG